MHNLLGKTIFFLVLFTPNQLLATTWPASDCEVANVQAAINLASDGDTVTIPSGTCEWTSLVTFNKAIKIQGAGTTSTIITNNIDNNYGPVF